MTLSVGSTLGPYEIVGVIGAGGMGVVYRGRDGKLKRDVALKILPAAFATDPDRRARFEREGQVLASLNHPNIAQIHGLEDTGSSRALVMELVEGPTLADRIAEGPLPLHQALTIARQIADALEAAHEHGIIHRDLKPSNIKVRRDGRVTVLDFGLAKMLDPATLESSASPTVTSAAKTGAGLVMGTAAYMSPEQAQGRPADKRSDIWAFGCVMFEMLTGQAPFTGETVTVTLANVLRTEPDWKALPATVPEPVRTLLRRCLEKECGRRLRDIGDAGLEIDHARSVPAAAASVANERRGASRLVWPAAAVILALVALALAVKVLAPASPLRAIHVEINTPPFAEPEDGLSFAVAPDGQRVAFVGIADGQTMLWVRSLDSFDVTPVAGTRDAQAPFWSLDGRSLGFFAEGLLKRVDVEGGLVRTLTPAPAGWGGTWNARGDILFSPSPASPILRVSEHGGPVEPITELQAGGAGHWRPQFLPDGRHFVYYVEGGARGMYLAELGKQGARKLFDSTAPAVFGAGHFFFARDGRIFAQPFDTSRNELTGSPSLVAAAPGAPGVVSHPRIAVGGGMLALRTGTPLARRLTWFDRSGKPGNHLGDEDAGVAPSLSPDDRSLAVMRRVDGNADVWLFDLSRGGLARVTTDPAEDVFPVWSPNGDRVAFTSNRRGEFELFQKSIGGSGREERLMGGMGNTLISDWSSDGQFFLLANQKAGIWDILAARVHGDTTPFPVVQSEFDERNGQFSPDGRWVAYQSNRTGRSEVFIQPFPGPGSPQPVSTNGGAQPRWRSDGTELFYLALDGTLMAAPIRSARDGSRIEIGSPKPLFRAYVGRVLTATPGPQYVVSRDGQRFLMNSRNAGETGAPIRMILNWAGPR